MLQIAKAVELHEKVLNVKPKNQSFSVASGIKESNKLLSPQKLYFNLISYREGVRRLVEEGKRFDITFGKKIVTTIVRSPEAVREELKKNAMEALNAGSLSTYTVLVTINAIQMGAIFKYSEEEQVELALAALLHEIGFYTLPDSLRIKKQGFSAKELKLVKAHPEASYWLIKKYGKEYEGVAEVARQVHERFDGSGYPRKLKQNEIHEHASIIGILDMYNSMVQNPDQPQQLSPADAIKEIITNCKGRFSTRIIRELVSQLSVYPVQSYIRLNNSSIGMVVNTDAMWPLKPTVKILCDAKGKKVAGETIINLSENPLLYVTEVISNTESICF